MDPADITSASGQVERHTYDYVRHGTTCPNLDPADLFAALEVASGSVIGKSAYGGKVIAKCQPKHRHQEFLKFLKLLIGAGNSLHLIIDFFSHTCFGLDLKFV